MRTRYLFFLLLTVFFIPWVVLLIQGEGFIGKPAAEADVLFAGDSDVYDGVWHFWWVGTALQNKTDPRIYLGNSLAWHNMGWPDLFFSYLTGSGYNLVLFFSTLFSAFAGYMLARSWGIGKSGSLITAFIIAWMPVRLIRVYQHYMLAGIGFVVLALYGFRKGFLSGKGKYDFIVLISTFFALMQSLSFSLILAVGYVITAILTKKARLKRKLFLGFVSLAGGVIALIWFFTAPLAFDTSPEMSWTESVHWAAEPLWFLFPSFLGKPLVIEAMPNPFEGVVSPGFTVAVLALIFVFKKKSWVSLACVVAVIILSMGPLLKVNGEPTGIPLPFLVIAKMPFLSAARTPSRFALITGLMAALAAGKFIENRKSALGWLLTLFVIIELIPIKLNTISSTVHSCYLSSESNLPLTLEIPASRFIRRYSLFQTQDGAPRKIMFLARGGQWQEDCIPEPLLWASNVKPMETDLLNSGAARVIYNRWMFEDPIRTHYDTLYNDLFAEQNRSDSVWIWTQP